MLNFRKDHRSVIGMVHLSPLAGAPRYGDNCAAVRTAAVRDAEALAEGGVHAIMVENFGDVPFFPGRVPAEVVAQMTAIAAEVRRATDLPLGINVLRNDGCSALAIAQAAGAQFIRVNVLCGARVTDQGIVHGIAHDLLRLRRHLGADDVGILADVDVKHSAPLAARAIEEEVADTVERGLADGLIVSGSGTGRPTDLETLRRVKSAAGAVPVFVGSGVTADTVASFLPNADGFIVGTAFKHEARAVNPVDVNRVREFISRLS
jgi:uncharacterized protein